MLSIKLKKKKKQPTNKTNVFVGKIAFSNFNMFFKTESGDVVI